MSFASFAKRYREFRRFAELVYCPVNYRPSRPPTKPSISFVHWEKYLRKRGLAIELNIGFSVLKIPNFDDFLLENGSATAWFETEPEPTCDSGGAALPTPILAASPPPLPVPPSDDVAEEADDDVGFSAVTFNMRQSQPNGRFMKNKSTQASLIPCPPLRRFPPARHTVKIEIDDDDDDIVDTIHNSHDVTVPGSVHQTIQDR